MPSMARPADDDQMPGTRGATDWNMSILGLTLLAAHRWDIHGERILGITLRELFS